MATCFSTGTGSGSAAELLSGSFIIPVTTSLTGITENDDSDTPDLVAVNKGSGASAVYRYHVPFQRYLHLNSTKCGTSAFYSCQLCLCPFSAYSVFQSHYSVNCSFPSTKWSKTCTTTRILLISVSFGTIWGGGCNMHFYPKCHKYNLFG